MKNISACFIIKFSFFGGKIFSVFKAYFRNVVLHSKAITISVNASWK